MCLDEDIVPNRLCPGTLSAGVAIPAEADTRPNGENRGRDAETGTCRGWNTGCFCVIADAGEDEEDVS